MAAVLVERWDWPLCRGQITVNVLSPGTEQSGHSGEFVER